MTLLSDIREGIRLSWDALRVNMLRSVLTTVGIVIGVVTVTLMATAMNWLDRSFREAVSFIGTDVLYVDQREWFIDSYAKWRAAQRRNKITLAQVNAVKKNLSMVLGVAPTVFHRVESVTYGNRSVNTVLVVGTDDEFLITGGITLDTGRFMTRAEALGNRDICVIGSRIVESLFERESPLGHRIRIGDQLLEIVGTLEKRGMAFGRMDLDNQVIIPIQKMVRGFQGEPSCTIQVKVGDAGRIESTREELRGLMRKVRKVPPGRDDDFAINQQQELVSQFDRVSTIIAAGGFFITGLSLLVGGIGIMNIMFVSVTERTHEIGLRKAIGARNRTILLQFLIEAASVCLLGGLIALAFAQVIIYVAGQYFPNVSLPVSAIILALAVAIGTGLISGFLPAWRAARLPPVEALRKE